MARVIVTGHGGYAAAVQGNLQMLLGEPEGFLFVDFLPGEGIDDLTAKLEAAVAQCGAEDILFVCDLAGGSPFRQSAMLCIDHPERAVVCGVNSAACCELWNNAELSADELADLAIEVTKIGVIRFPEGAADE